MLDTAMLDSNTQAQLAAYFERIQTPIELIASLDERPASVEMRALLTEIAAIAPAKISARFDGHDARRPSFQITRVGADTGVRFAAIPMGHEFTSLVLALLQAGLHPPKLAADIIEQIKSLPIDGELHFETYLSLSCHNCPDVVQALNMLAVLNPKISHVAIDGALNQAEVDARQIMAVPSVYLNGEPFYSGRMEIGDILAKIDTGNSARDAAKLGDKAPFDVLIVGGGPAGAAAAVYAARKGIRTGIVAERFGGQTLDTMGIENFISVLETVGPTFAAALEAHVKHYNVDVMNLQRVARITPAEAPGGYATLLLDNGAELKSRSVILATGARWKNINVPGEQQYKNKGVAYCPHCDGPLFKGKDVAVIGGGNSGVEAAIDLAGLVKSVTLLEFDSQLRADAVLVDKLRSLPNVTIHTSAQTHEITGDGQKMNGLRYQDRLSGAEHHIDLAGVFIQIGLVPNTEFLKGTVELSKFGEIIIDAKCHTSVPGIFAAGDVTTVPYKQIIIAAGEGSKAALSAFDHLIRMPAVALAPSSAVPAPGEVATA